MYTVISQLRQQLSYTCVYTKKKNLEERTRTSIVLYRVCSPFHIYSYYQITASVQHFQIQIGTFMNIYASTRQPCVLKCYNLFKLNNATTCDTVKSKCFLN
jgi:hypothetical protein